MTMEQTSVKSFEQVLNSTLGMMRTSWNVPACLFIQIDDKGLLRVRAADGLKSPVRPVFGFKPGKGLVARCLEKNEVIESNAGRWDESMDEIITPLATRVHKKFVIVP